MPGEYTKMNRTLLSTQVEDQIIDYLIHECSIGDKLPNEFELAESLNVGRGTIREAVKLLVARNCLEIRRGKGTYVKEPLQPGHGRNPARLRDVRYVDFSFYA